MSKRVKLLVDNIIVFGLSRMMVMIVPLVILPIISRKMTDITFFGIASIATTIMTLISHIVIMGTTDAAMRFSFDNLAHDYKKKVFSTNRTIILFTNLIIIIFSIVFKNPLSRLFFGSKEYSIIFMLAIISSFINSMIYVYSTPTRSQNNRKLFVISSFLSVVVTYTVALLLIENGIYLYALPLGTLFGLLSSFVVFYLREHKNFVFKLFDKNISKKLLSMGAPLVLAYLSLWIYQSSDKLLLTHLSNLTEVGIYSVGAKIASVASLVYIAFNTGWSYFSYETMNDKDQVQLISNIFRFFVVVMFITIFLSNIFVLPIFKLIFVGDYVLGAYVAPLLLSAPFVQVLIQILATQFLIQKNSKIYSIAQLIGVLVNIGLNIPLIIYFGAIGAAFATALSYLVPLSILLIVTIRQNKISIKKIEMYLFTFLMTWFYFSVLLINFDYFLQSVLMNFLGIFLVIYFYKRNILSMSKILLQILKKKGDLL